jgi:uncharacterized protein (TIGR02271 family)
MATYDVNALLSATAYGSDGDKIGKVQQVFLDDNTEDVTFVTVNTGLFGTKESFVPVDGAQQDGDRLVLPYTKEVVKDAPNVDADQHLSPSEEEEIYRYYKMNYSGAGNGTAGYADNDRGTDYVGTGTTGRDSYDTVDTDRNAVPGGGLAGGAAGYAVTDRDTSAASGEEGYAETDRTAGYAETDRTAGYADRDVTDRDLTDRDNGVVRHEERLHVGKENVETGRARLRKYVVTDHETVDVAVQREEVRVERTPLNGTEATTGTIGEEDVEVVLHEERPVVAKETVGVERVELDKEVVTDTQRVDADVRKEQVEVETDTDRGLTDRDRRI